MATSFETLAQQFRVQGHKLTQPRRAILRALLATPKPLSPAEIQERGQKLYGDLGLVTVYRTLELMETMGVLRAVHLADGCHGYALATPAHAPCRVRMLPWRRGDRRVRPGPLPGSRRRSDWLHDHRALAGIAGICPACQRRQAD